MTKLEQPEFLVALAVLETTTNAIDVVDSLESTIFLVEEYLASTNSHQLLNIKEYAHMLLILKHMHNSIGGQIIALGDYMELIDARRNSAKHTLKH